MGVEFTLIVPFYNEQKIVRTYKELSLYLAKHIPRYAIIFVNDGSDSNFFHMCKRAIAADSHASLIGYSKNQGRGYAVMQGIKASTSPYVGYIDGDLEISPAPLLSMVEKLSSFDVVIGSKVHKQSYVTTTLYRRWSSIFFNLIVRLILGSKIYDHQTGLKVFRRNVVSPLIQKITERKWLFDVELLYLLQQNGYTIEEVPVRVTYGFTKIRRSFVTEYLTLIYSLWNIRLRHLKLS